MQNLIENIELFVPQEKFIRLQIRKAVDMYFAETNIIPPVTYEQLNKFAINLIELNQWGSELLAFVMVCCGNSIWRTVLGTVPFKRRILLLPQCLKNSQSCEADIDEFGLICQSCGNCSVQSFTDEAEKLGYVVLVTEGTTLTSKLIESGKIDGVIGVGCMDVLQKMFKTVQKHAVPGIGIPLLGNGCKDTVADREWIIEEMHNFDQKKGIKLLELNHIKSKVQSIFNFERLQVLFGQLNDDTIGIAIKSLLLGGNRHRAFLTALVYEAFCTQPNTETLSRLALSIECFHKASLIHDDIEDNDFARYGKDTIHAEHGVPVAINAGDLLIGEGYRLITEAGLDAEIALKCIRLVSVGHKAISMGQGAELLCVTKGNILSVKEMINVFELKTATAFKVSILLGAIAGNADEISINLLEKFSSNIGIAYQLQDDLQDFNSNGGDIEKRKFSILISLLLNRIDTKELLKLQFFLKSNDFKGIFKLIGDYNVKDKAIEMLEEYIQNAKTDLEGLKNPGLKIALNGILGKMFPEHF
jgi:geranylgeranyl diphosphate synthase, type II